MSPHSFPWSLRFLLENLLGTCVGELNHEYVTCWPMQLDITSFNGSVIMAETFVLTWLFSCAMRIPGLHASCKETSLANLLISVNWPQKPAQPRVVSQPAVLSFTFNKLLPFRDLNWDSFMGPPKESRNKHAAAVSLQHFSPSKSILKLILTRFERSRLVLHIANVFNLTALSVWGREKDQWYL